MHVSVSKVLRLLPAVLVLMLPGCERRPTEPGGGGMGELQINAAVNTPTVSTLVVEVTAADLSDPLIFNFEFVGGIASGTVRVPAGGRRTITVRAFDVGGIQTHEGSAQVNIRPGPNPTVRITLRPLTGQQPIEIVLGTFTITVAPLAATLDAGQTLQMLATVRDVDGRVVATTAGVVWASDAPAVATVSPTGLVTAHRDGSARIVASFGGVATAAQITVIGFLLGTDAQRGDLIVVDLATGAATVIGPMGAGSVPALATDPATGIVYSGRGAGTPLFYSVNPGTGQATLIGNSGLGFAAIGGMDFAPDGVLYAAVNVAGDGGEGADHLATINKATGAATIIGPFGTCTGVTIPSTGGGSCTLEGMEAIAFRPDGALFGALSPRGIGASGLYRIDPATGTASFVTAILDELGNPPSGGVVSLQFLGGGTLFGGTARAMPPATDGGRLIVVDPSTGIFRFVGSVAATGGTSLGALAPRP